MVTPTDFSDVLDPRSHNTCTSELILHHSQSLGKTVYSLSRHPGKTHCLADITEPPCAGQINYLYLCYTGCHIVSGMLNGQQQQDLFRESLADFPEPPNRSNLTAQHGRLPSLWSAAQQGLFLHSHIPDNNSRSQLATCIYTQTDSQDPSLIQVPQSDIHATSSATAHTAAMHSCHSDNRISDCNLRRAGTSSKQQNAAAEVLCSPSASSTHSSKSDAHPNQQESSASCDHKPSEQGRWQSAPGGPSATSLLYKLRWVALGPQFNWSTRQYEQEAGVRPLPPQLVSLAQLVVKACQESFQQDCDSAQSAGDGVSTQANSPQHACARSACMLCGVGDQHAQYEPDTALVNFYRNGDTLGGHKDDAELHADRPIVSLSLGCDAVFLIGGVTRDVVPTAVWLHSGDAVVLSGAARQCYHGVPRVVPCQTSFDCCMDSVSAAGAQDMPALHAYMHSTRVNISIRQM